jgi:hypothetical protein
MEMVIDLGQKGYLPDLIANSLTMIKQELSFLMTSYGYTNKSLVVVDYKEDSHWRDFVRG